MPSALSSSFAWPPRPLLPAYRAERLPPREGADQRTEAARLHFEDWLGRPVALYAERARPVGAGNGAGVLHCVGGAQTVHGGDLAFWTQAGYAAASFDWQLRGVTGRDPDRTSRFPDELVPQFSPTPGLEAAVLPVAVQGAAVCLQWLADCEGVDPARLGVSGISWGGYLAWLLTAYDERVRAVVPAFGCGGLFARRSKAESFPKTVREFWSRHWEPQALATRIRAPAAFLSGTNDFFGDLLLAEGLLGELPSPSRRYYLPNVDHSLDASASRLARAWMDHYLNDGPPVPAAPRLIDETRVETDPSAQVESVRIWWSDTAGTAQFRCWQPGPPPGNRDVLAFAQVRHANGIDLSSAVRHFAAASRAGTPTGKRHPFLPFGLGWRWETGSTRLFLNDAGAIPPATPSDAWIVVPARPDSDEVVVVFLHPDPAASESIRADHPLWIRWSATPDDDARVTLYMRGEPTESRSFLAPWTNGAICLDPAKVAKLSPAFDWAQVGRIEVAAKQPRIPFAVGPVGVTPSSTESSRGNVAS